MKSVRMAFHFMLKSDGTENFLPDGDGLGNSEHSGYEIAKETIRRYNNQGNEWLNIPPNHNIPVNDRNINFILEAVYFHYDDNYAVYQHNGTNGTNMHNLYKENPDNVIQCYMNTYNSSYTPNTGFVTSLSHNTIRKFFVLNSPYEAYVRNLNENYPIDWFYHGFFRNVGHETFHLLGLKHTVLRPDGQEIPLTNTTIDDGCSDTPTPWELINIYGVPFQFPWHPGSNPNNDNSTPTISNPCGWNNSWNYGCSSNYMDYNGAFGLSPCQLDIMHVGLDGGMTSYKICHAVANDVVLDELAHPKISYFGKKVTIESPNASTSPNLEDSETADIYFSEDVIFNEVEIGSNATLEVFYTSSCQ